MTNKQRRAIVDEAKSKGYQGSYIDLFKQAALNPSGAQEVLTADTPLEKEEGLRPQHEAGRTDASMAFTDVPPNTPFNTVGMKAPIDIKKYDEQGHLVKSYESVPPGIQNLNTGPRSGTVLETPARMQEGGRLDEAARLIREHNLKEDGTFENIVEMFDPTGISAWDDAYRAYTSMKERGASYPNMDEALDMLGAVPVMGKAKAAINLYKKSSKPIQYGLTQAYNKIFRHTGRAASIIDGIEDETGFLDSKEQNKPVQRQTGGYNPGEYMNKMQPKVFPNQKRDAQWVNYTTKHDFAGRFPGETKSNRELGLEISNRNTVPLPPNPTVPKELKRAQEGSIVGDFLLPALSSDSPVEFANQQSQSQQQLVTKSQQDLEAENQRVQQVRANVIPTAKNIASRWENMSSEDKAAYDDILDYAPNSSVTGLAPPTRGKTRGQQTSEVRQKLADRPESLKEYMPNYNIFLDQPDKFGTNRGVYCTTMGCYAYEKAGARQITDKNGHPMRGNTQFVNATKQGVSGFEQIDSKDRQPGDLAVLRGSSRADYNDPKSITTRDHHTVIYAGESDRKEDSKSVARGAWDWLTGASPEEKREYNYNNPGAIKAYSAEGGNMDKFQLATRNNENPENGEAFKFYRYIGQTPQMTGRAEEAKQRQSKADMVAAALNEQAARASTMQKETALKAPDKLESLGASQIENEAPERKIIKPRASTGNKPSVRSKVESLTNKVKGKAYEIKDKRKSKEPKAPKEKTPSAKKQIRSKYRDEKRSIRKGQ